LLGKLLVVGELRVTRWVPKVVREVVVELRGLRVLIRVGREGKVVVVDGIEKLDVRKTDVLKDLIELIP
jgi:hypothetical protein